MKNTFAEFISPYVSQVHQSDPTIDAICFTNDHFKYLAQITPEVISLFRLISSGNSIEVDKTQIFQLQIISILLKNDELFRKLDSLFPRENDENKVKEAFEIISFLEENAESLDMIDKSKYVGRIASKLYSIDVSTIKSLPKSVFYSIIKNDELALENEDMLLDLIDAFFSEGETEPEEAGGQSLCKIDFYEEVNFDFLRKDKFKEFIKKIEMNEMTTTLCNNLKKGFFAYKKSTSKIRLFEYNDKKEYAFKGIIHKLTEKC